MSLCPSVRPSVPLAVCLSAVCTTQVCLSATARPLSPAFLNLFPFYSLFPSSFAQLDSDAAEQLDVDVRGSAFPTTLINGGGKKSVALTEPPSIQPRPNLQPGAWSRQPGAWSLQPGAWSLPASNTPTCRACQLFLEASLSLSWAAESYSWEAALLRKRCEMLGKMLWVCHHLLVAHSGLYLEQTALQCADLTLQWRKRDAFDELIKTQLI